MEPSDLERVVKDESLISCDNVDCAFYGDMFYCYLNNQRRCGIYTSWEKRKMRKRQDKFDYKRKPKGI